jgi:sugar lactone lactonase YvrE
MNLARKAIASAIVPLVVGPACATSTTPREPRGRADAREVQRIGELQSEIRAQPSGAAYYSLAYHAAKVGLVREALDALDRLDATGWDAPLVEPEFAPLAGSPAYRAIATRIAAREPVVHESVPGFTIAERGLHAEGIAYDANAGAFYVGSTTSGRVVAVDAAGRARDVARTGLREVLGLKVGGPGHLLWAACTDDERTDGDTCVLALDVATGAVARRACLAGPGHELNDLAVASDGTVYVTDSTSGAVLRLPRDATRLDALVPAGRMRGSNGIVLTPDERAILVAHSRGIARVDVATGEVVDLAHEPGASLCGIDGMSLRDRTLYAIANTYGHPRVVRIGLDAALKHAEHVEVAETENALWDEPTTGTLGPDGFYYVADSQMNSGAAPRETVVLRIPFAR